MIKKIFFIALATALCLSLTAYSATSWPDDDDVVEELGFIEDWNGITDTTNGYFFLFEETIVVDNKEVDDSPDYRYIYTGSDIYVPVAVYQLDVKGYVRATDKLAKTDNLSMSSKVVTGPGYVGDVELVDGKKLKLDGMEPGMYARIPIRNDYSGSYRATVMMRLVLAVNNVTYQDTQVTLKFRIRNRVTEIDKNSVYGAKTPSQFKVKRTYSGEATFDFGNNIKYTSKVRENDVYYMHLSREQNPDITEMYPDAFLDFYSFLGDNKTFASTGTLSIPVKRSSLAKNGDSESLYVYRVDGDTLTSLGSNTVSYDSKTETLTIKAKTLRNYVLSNQALKKEVDGQSDDILKSGYAAVSESAVSEITGTASSSSQAAARSQEDDDGYVPEESAANSYPTGNINDNVETGGYINATNKSADNPNTAGPAAGPAFVAMLAAAGAALAALRRR